MRSIASYALMLLSITLGPSSSFIQQARAQAVPVNGPGLPEGFIEVPMSWDFKFGDEAITPQGTIEEALAQMKAMKAGISQDRFIQAMSDAHPSIAPSNSNPASKTDKATPVIIDCLDPAFTSRLAWKEPIMEGINVLKEVFHPCYIPAHPRNETCARVSCSYHSGIFMCGMKGLRPSPMCSDLAPMAEAIVEACTDDSEMGFVRGTYIPSARTYLVHVGGASC